MATQGRNSCAGGTYLRVLIADHVVQHINEARFLNGGGGQVVHFQDAQHACAAHIRALIPQACLSAPREIPGSQGEKEGRKRQRKDVTAPPGLVMCGATHLQGPHDILQNAFQAQGTQGAQGEAADHGVVVLAVWRVQGGRHRALQ